MNKVYLRPIGKWTAVLLLCLIAACNKKEKSNEGQTVLEIEAKQLLTKNNLPSASVLPLKKEKLDEFINFTNSLKTGYTGKFTASRIKCGITKEIIWIQNLSTGPAAILFYQAVNPEGLFGRQQASGNAISRKYLKVLSDAVSRNNPLDSFNTRLVLQHQEPDKHNYGYAFILTISVNKRRAHEEFIKMMNTSFRSGYEKSRQRVGITCEYVWIKENEQGSSAIYYIESPDLFSVFPTLAGSDEDFDKWYVNNLEQIYDAKPGSQDFPPQNEMIFRWSLKSLVS